MRVTFGSVVSQTSDCLIIAFVTPGDRASRATGRLDGHGVESGGRKDWNALTAQFHPYLVGLATRKFRLDDEEARALTQQVIADWLVRSEKHGGSMGCRSDQHLLAILCQNLTRRWIDRIRRSSRNEPLADDLPMREPPEDLVVLLQRRELIQEEFSRLPVQRRAALYAVYIDGATQDEAAEDLKIDRRLISDWKRSFEAALARRAKEIGLDV